MIYHLHLDRVDYYHYLIFTALTLSTTAPSANAHRIITVVVLLLLLVLLNPSPPKTITPPPPLHPPYPRHHLPSSAATSSAFSCVQGFSSLHSSSYSSAVFALRRHTRRHTWRHTCFEPSGLIQGWFTTRVYGFGFRASGLGECTVYFGLRV